MTPERDGAAADDALAPYLRELGPKPPSAEAERMRGRLAAKLFDLGPSEPDRIGRFELRERIGAGAMGVVYEAWDPELDRRVAIKLLYEAPGRWTDPDSGKRLLREAKAMARLRHPNVVQVHEVGTHADQVFVAMELIDGTTLRAWLAERPRSWRAIVEVFAAAGRGLAAAHAAGLVHRDFKPDNVLIEGGRVFVGDFGLARGQAADDERSEPVTLSDAPSPNVTLTRTGAAVGTPAYMAPEAFEQATPDPRADQYSFCASLYEALYGQHPWSADSLSQLRTHKSEAPAKPPSRTPSAVVPRWLRRLIVRGLAPTPEARFASMDALLLELERGLRRARWWRRDAWLVLGLVAGTIGGAWAIASSREPTVVAAAACSDAEQRLDPVWNRAREARVLAALGSGDLDYADELAERTVTQIEAYAREWMDQHRSACEATHVRGEQSERTLELRMRCLDRRRSELDALLARFESPRANDRVNAIEAVHTLTPSSACENVELLESTTPVPEAPRVRAEVERLRVELDAINAAIATGNHVEVEAESVALLAAARQIGYRPLLAEAGVAAGIVASRTGRPKDAEVLLDQAIVDAQASGHDEVAARAMIASIYVVGFQLHDEESGERVVRQGRALLERIGDPPRLLAMYTGNVGTFEVARGRLDQGHARFEQAIALWTALNGESHFSVAESRSNLAAVERKQGNNEAALALYVRARRDLEVSLGPAHPNLFTVMNNTAAALLALDRDAEAEALLRETLALAARVMPDEHASIGHPYNNLGELFVGQGRHAEARDSFTSAIESWTRSLGPEHRLIGHALTGRGLARLELGDAAGAREDLERARVIRKAQTRSSTALGETEFILARTLAELGEPRSEVLALARIALEHLGERDGDLITRAQVRAWLDAR